MTAVTCEHIPCLQLINQFKTTFPVENTKIFLNYSVTFVPHEEANNVNEPLMIIMSISMNNLKWKLQFVTLRSLYTKGKTGKGPDCAHPSKHPSIEQVPS